jgi:hypothetical protein
LRRPTPDEDNPMRDQTPQEFLADFFNSHQPNPRGRDQAIMTWALANDDTTPDAGHYNRAAVALFCELARYLQEEDPEEMGWGGLRNRELADKLLEGMATPHDAAPPGSKGMLALNVFAKDGLVALRYTDDLVVALPVATARQLAEGLLTVAGQIDGQRALLTMLGRPIVGGDGA